MTDYYGLEAPRLRLLRDSVGLPGDGAVYEVAHVDRLETSPDCEVEAVRQYVQVDVLGHAH